MVETKRGGSRSICHLSLSAVALAASTHVHALELDTGNPDLSVRFDNTVKLSVLNRLQDADARLVNSFGPGIPQALNFNAGNDNFRNKGLVSKRIDLFSEFDAVWRKDFGLRLSGAAWYDGAYSGTSDAQDAPGFFGPGNGQVPYNQFYAYTKESAGRKVELLDAFVFGGWDVGSGQRLTVRLGRHALQWGESLFFGDNGIARAQGPIDIWKLQSSPNAQFKEVIRPVPQISGQLQINPTMSVGAYYQFRWEADRMPPAGSYFNAANNTWGGSPFQQFLSLPPAAGPLAGNYALAPAGDKDADDGGQFGLQFKWRVAETDLGVYFARYHDKGGQLFNMLNLADNATGQWYYRFPEGVRTLGVSASRSIGDANVAIEASVRDNMPLVNQAVIGVLGAPESRLAKGKTAHVNVSWLATLPPNPIASEMNFLGELAWNRVLSMDDPSRLLDTGRTRDAAALQLLLAPMYRQVLPGLDLSVPVGLRYTLSGNSAITGLGWGPKGAGTFSVGVEGTYESTWQFGLNYTRFIGKAAPFLNYQTLEYSRGNTLADRDFVSLTVRRTF